MFTSAVTQLFIYPIKSMGPVPVQTLKFSEFGPHADRQYMLVNEKGRFVTQRSHPVLSQFHLESVKGGWQVRFGHDQILIPDAASTDRLVTTQVWKSLIQAREKSREVSAWFSNHLDEWVMMVEMDDLERRTVEVEGQPRPLAFADGYPLLVCNEQSHAALESSVGQPLELLRWRPNVVISIPAEAEYSLKRLEVSGDRERYLALSKPCVRCNIPAIDPKTGVFSKSLHEAFSERLLRDGQVIFGVNAAPVGLTELAVGDVLVGC